MTEPSHGFGEVSRRVKRFKLDTPITKPPATGSVFSTPSSSAGASSDSVYGHIAGIEDIQQLRGLRCARRRGRFRLIRRTYPEADLAKQYADAISYLTPIFAQETQKQFVNSITDLGKEPQNKYAAEINKYKNRPSALKAKRRRLDEEEEPRKEVEEEQPQEDITELTEEEIEKRRLKREVLAAIAAITAGVKQEEMIQNLYNLSQKKSK